MTQEAIFGGPCIIKRQGNAHISTTLASIILLKTMLQLVVYYLNKLGKINSKQTDETSLKIETNCGREKMDN